MIPSWMDTQVSDCNQCTVLALQNDFLEHKGLLKVWHSGNKSSTLEISWKVVVTETSNYDSQTYARNHWMGHKVTRSDTISF